MWISLLVIRVLCAQGDPFIPRDPCGSARTFRGTNVALRRYVRNGTWPIAIRQSDIGRVSHPKVQCGPGSAIESLALGADRWELEKLLIRMALHGEKDGHLLILRRERA